MSLLHRIARLFKADIHGILDALEEPDVMLKQAIREMQEEIERSESHLKTVAKQLERLTQKSRELDSALTEFDSQIDFCFGENNEAMAKTLLRKKLETRQKLKAVERHRKALAEEQTLLEAEVAGRQDKLKSILDKMALFTERYVEISETDGEGASQAVTQEELEIAFLQEKQQRAQRQKLQEMQP